MRTVYLILIMLITSHTISFGQERNKMSAEKFEAQKIAFITSKLDLTPNEAQNFWPVFNEFQKKMESVKEKYRPQVSIEELTEENAENLVMASLAMAEEELALKKEYTNRFRGVISMKKIATLQLVDREFKRQMLNRLKDRKAMRKERNKK